MKQLWNKYQELIFYIFFGGCTFLVDTGVFFFFSGLFDLSENAVLLHVCSVSATLIAIVFAYITNRSFVFQSKASGFKNILNEMFRFFSARFFTLVLAEVLMEITVMQLSFSERLMKLVVNIIVIALNYIFSKCWIFRKKKAKFELCVFDLDGTLVNSIYDIADAMNYALTKMQKPTHSLDAFYQMVGDGMEVLCKRALADGTEEEIQTLIALYKERYLTHCAERTKPYDGILELLATLKRKGIKLGILSNKPQEQTNEVTAALLGEQNFIQVIGQSAKFPKKPDTTSLYYLIQKSGVEKEKVCYIGDSNVDMILGRSAQV